MKIATRTPSKYWQQKTDTKTSGNIFTTTFFYNMSLIALIIFMFVIAYTTANGTQLGCMDLIFLNQSSARDTLNVQQYELLKQCERDAPPIAELK